MPSYSPVVPVRMEPNDLAALREQARRLEQSLGKRITVSHVVRLAVQDYLRRLG